MSGVQRLRGAVKKPIVRALKKRGIYRLSSGPADFTIRNNTREAIDAFYRHEESVQEYLSDERIRFYDEAVDLIAGRVDLHGKTIADVGCGTGHLLARLADRGPAELTGYDFSEAALEIARKVCPAATIGFYDVYEAPPERVDVVACCEVIEHLFYPAAALRNLAAMADETLFLTVPDGRRDTYIGHVNFWSPESWKVFLGETLPGRSIETGLMTEGENLYAFVR